MNGNVGDDPDGLATSVGSVRRDARKALGHYLLEERTEERTASQDHGSADLSETPDHGGNYVEGQVALEVQGCSGDDAEDGHDDIAVVKLAGGYSR